MDKIETVQKLMRLLDSLTLKGVQDWEHAMQMAQMLIDLKHEMEAETK